VALACTAARKAGWNHVLLVGDAPYFSRMGFCPAPSVTMPGPVDQRRVLNLRLRTGPSDLAGQARV
jgi:predicted N-acetyltransferase YhbS